MNESTLVEARESDRGDSSHFELFIEETLEHELSQSLSIGSGSEKIAEDHVLNELDGSASCMPFGARTNLRDEERREVKDVDM